MERQYKDSGNEWIGRIPETWKSTKLFNLCTIKGRIGWNGLRSDEFKEKSYAYLVTGQDFCSSEIDWSKCYQIDKERYDEDPFIQLDNGDILITKDGTIGKIAKVSNMDKPACLNSGIFVLKQRKETFVQNYLYWYLASPLLIDYNSYINSGGTTIMHLYQNVFERFPMLIPSIKEQKRIADYLDEKCGEIDSLIGIQEQMIEKLKAYKQSVITEAVTKGLNSNAKLVSSGIDWIGEIPEGWEIAQLKRFLTFQNGQDYKAIETKESEGFPVYGSGGVFAYAAKYMYNGESVLFGRKGTVNKPLYVNCCFWTVDTMYYTIPSEACNCKFMYYVATTLPYDKYSTSTALPSMTQSILGNLMITIPPIAEQQAIASYLDKKCSEIDKLIDVKQLKIEKLKDYKKSVIYEAVTGKINIES
jgi:type I restriction enzyme S subunit